MRLKRKQKGFTIVELMIATSAFSVVLLVCLGAMVYVGRLYYKGVTTTQTQSAARDAAESISDSVRFSRERIEIGAPDASSDWTGHICVGSRKYSYKLDTVLVNGDVENGKDQANEVLIESIDPACDLGGHDAEPRTNDATLGADFLEKYPPREILGEYMRLNSFEVSEPDNITGIVTISISIAYGGDGSDGDKELFNYVSGDSGEIASCKAGVAGAQFCALSSLTKTVRGVQ